MTVHLREPAYQVPNPVAAAEQQDDAENLGRMRMFVMNDMISPANWRVPSTLGVPRSVWEGFL